MKNINTTFSGANFTSILNKDVSQHKSYRIMAGTTLTNSQKVNQIMSVLKYIFFTPILCNIGVKNRIIVAKNPITTEVTISVVMILSFS